MAAADDPIKRARTAISAATDALAEGRPDALERVVESLRLVARELARLEAIEHRFAAEQRVFDERLLRVENNRLFTVWKRVISALAPYANGKSDTKDAADYALWLAHELAELPTPSQASHIAQTWTAQPVISFVPVVGTTPDLQGSVSAQMYRHVEVAERVDCARGNYVCFVSGDCEPSPWAAYYFAEAAHRTACDVMYADEDTLQAGQRCRPVFKPCWSPELLQSCMYWGSMFAVRRELIDGRADADLHAFALELARRTDRIINIPRILCHSRGRRLSFEPQSWGADNGPATAIVCSRNAALLARCLNSLRSTAAGQVTAIVVVAHEETGVNEDVRAAARNAGASLVSYTGPFNFSTMNNLGASAANTPYLLFVNDDVTAGSAGWAQRLLYQVSRERIGVAGAVMWYPDGGLQHAGIVCGIGDGVGHAGRGSKGSDMWPWLAATRNVSAVTGACLAIRNDLFRRLGGFDAEFPNNYNDVDLCLRARESGLEVVCVGVQGVVHAECQTRQGVVRFDERYKLYRRWSSVLARTDPYYSPSLAPTEKIALNL
jgi:GT2 family glycosyltransferase